jgi:hypothetical protein
MSTINESVKKGPLMTMTLECETEFPNVLKNLMLGLGMNGEAVYKGFPVIDEGQEYWWVQLHLYKNKEDDPKSTGFCMFTNSEMHPSFFDSARNAAWKAIEELGERLKYRMLNTQEDLKEEKRLAQDSKATVKRLSKDIIGLALELCDQDKQIAAKDAQIATLVKKE